jgi:type IV secretory pathway protease TraF
MAPTLLEGTVVVARRIMVLRPGQILLFHHNGLEKIKRLERIEPGGLYLLGDNRGGSTDSRMIGLVKPDTVIGVVIWPRRAEH